MLLERNGKLTMWKSKSLHLSCSLVENDIIPKSMNGVGIIPAYVPLIIEPVDMEPTKYYSLSAAARGCGILKQMIVL